MSNESEPPLDGYWLEYIRYFQGFDDQELGAWLGLTVLKCQNQVIRLSHPIISAYRLAYEEAEDRELWTSGTWSFPTQVPRAVCCQAPFLPLFTRDIQEMGLCCMHCEETIIPWNKLPTDLLLPLSQWSEQYEKVHAIAHWNEQEIRNAPNYPETYQNAANAAKKLLARAGNNLCHRLLEFFPIIVWEDQDECLKVGPDDIVI